MSIENAAGYSEAVLAIRANRSPRFDALDELERFVTTTQYEGRPSWFDASDSAKPLWERAPCIAYPLVQSAISSNADLLLGEGRFPAVTCIPDSPEEDEELDLDRARQVDRLIQRIIEQARLRKRSYEVLGAGQGCGTAVTICGVRGDKLFVDTTRAKWCTPAFDKQTGEVNKLQIQYPYLDYRKERGSWVVKAMLYRRVIDARQDITFRPAEARADGIEPTNWIKDPELSTTHGFGFCPVVWWAHMAEAGIVNRIDGHALHEHCRDEIQALDFALSQRHRAALYCGDPQIVEIGVDDRRVNAPTGRVASPKVWTNETPIIGRRLDASGNPIPAGEFVLPPDGKRARKKSPGVVWSLENKDAKVQLLTLPGDALKAIDEHARDLRIKIAESLSVVFLDPDSIKFAASLSGKALATLKARQLDRCDQYRDDFGIGWLIPQVKMLLRVVETRADGLKIRKAREALTAIDALGDEFDLHLRWGDYFKSSPDEDKAVVEVVAAAKRDSLVTKRRQVEYLAPTFDIENVDEELAALEEEAAEAEQKAQEQMHAEAKAFHDAARIDGNQTAGGARPGAQPNRPAGGNRGAAAAPTPARQARTAKPTRPGR